MAGGGYGVKVAVLLMVLHDLTTEAPCVPSGRIVQEGVAEGHVLERHRFRQQLVPFAGRGLLLGQVDEPQFDAEKGDGIRRAGPREVDGQIRRARAAIDGCAGGQRRENLRGDAVHRLGEDDAVKSRHGTGGGHRRAEAHSLQLYPAGPAGIGYFAGPDAAAIGEAREDGDRHLGARVSDSEEKAEHRERGESAERGEGKCIHG